MADNRIENQVLRNVNKDGKGKPYENMMSEAMAAYCIRQDLGYRIVVGTYEDKRKGTDFKVCDNLDIITAASGILRLDFTAAFSHKDNMPLLWTPQDPIEQLNGRPLMFGIRTGNAHSGFDYPVVVIGIDASRNEDPDDDVDIDLVMRTLKASTDKNAGAILSEAGSAMARYIYATNPAYAAWLETDEGQEAFFPDYDGLVPNFGGIDRFVTGRKSHETIAGLQLAKSRATDYMLEYASGSHEFEMAREFARRCAEKSRPPKGKAVGPDGPWMQQLALAMRKSQEYEMPDDGLTK